MTAAYPDIAMRPGFDSQNLSPQRVRSAAPAARPAAPERTQGANSAPEGSFDSFLANLVDIINPLQHIPVVSAIYRHITGDSISPGAKLVGDALYGGPIGGAVAAADIIFEKETGRDFGETAIAAVTPARRAHDSVMLAESKEDIIWQEPPASGTQIASLHTELLSPPSTPAGTIEEKPDVPSTLAQPVFQKKSAASTGHLHTQEAPARPPRKAVPPELIATRMMEALEKYAAMKQAQPVPQSIAALY